ncbi:hypothetical protein BU16DRAFT_536026 [Lophium mytilinum]|uniref:Uncharacterized protein n=1 Tax=Lophium mytilinum TaxID=390894 RepID=A0A6A6R562_9PEZI|nr:hypothetical protein BU16DRAFT_536026 [Lophium mytilinum]
MLLSALFLCLTVPIVAASRVRQAKHHGLVQRQGLTINDVCGLSPVDCGGGWCCYSGQNCIKTGGDPLCEDLLLTDVGGGPMTVYAIQWSSLVNGLSALTSLGVTLSTFPTTLTAATALPSYSNSDTSVVIPTWTGYPATTSTTSTSKGPAATVMPDKKILGWVPAAVALGVAAGAM